MKTQTADTIQIRDVPWQIVASNPTRQDSATAETSTQQGKIERDYEPEQKYGTAHDIQEHIRYGGTREDY